MRVCGLLFTSKLASGDVTKSQSFPESGQSQRKPRGEKTRSDVEGGTERGKWRQGGRGRNPVPGGRPWGGAGSVGSSHFGASGELRQHLGCF